MDLHPDRNYGKVEEATKQFAEVQSAYEILSDPQERAWYDTHREAVLRDEDDVSGEHYEHNVRITTAEDILRIFTRFHGKPDFSDAPTGFYGALRGTFDTLAREEELACEWEGLDPVTYQSFGHVDDNYDDVVRPFYAIWNGFATKKTFAWEDVYRYSEAPDRRIRRMMEKENKRFREEGIREFNDAVRSLVAFVKKRDPRFKPNVQSEAERQKILRDAAVAQAARSRAANHAKHAQPEVIPEWMKSSEGQISSISDEDEEAIKEQFECVVCNKSFKSEKQYDSHEKSRKHAKAANHIRRQMQQENKNLNLHEINERSAIQQQAAITPQASNEADVLTQEDVTYDLSSDAGNASLLGENASPPPGGGGTGCSEEDFRETRNSSPKPAPVPDSPASSTGDEYTSRERVENRIFGGQDRADDDSPGHRATPSDVNHLSDQFASESLDGELDSNPRSKVGKAKEKRAKKAAQKRCANVGAKAEFKCASCQVEFASKTRLFDHINELGHAQPVSKPAKGSKGKKI